MSRGFADGVGQGVGGRGARLGPASLDPVERPADVQGCDRIDGAPAEGDRGAFRVAGLLAPEGAVPAADGDALEMVFFGGADDDVVTKHGKTPRLRTYVLMRRYYTTDSCRFGREMALLAKL